MSSPKPSLQRVLTMFSLVLAGEAIFCLPFHISRYFRPAFVEVFQTTQTQLGVLGAAYGVIATFAYLGGGVLADRYPARKLLAFSLVATGWTGLYLARIPSFPEMIVLFAFWGVSTILPFWSALIRATRQWGGHDNQGEAFGILDGGRGFLAAGLAMLAVILFDLFLPEDGGTREEKRLALQSTISLYTITCFVAALLVWLLVPEHRGEEPAGDTTRPGTGHLVQVLKMPAIWLQAAIIICAYCLYKGGDYYAQFAKDIWGWSDVEAARLSAWSTWMRPFAAIGAGLAADRISSSRVVIGCFLLSGLAYVAMIASRPAAGVIWLLWANVLAVSVGIFALRGIYFALLEESRIPREMTGTAVGVVSFVGYTPEIFMPLLGGWLLDRWSGTVTGYQVLFACLCLASVVGMLAALTLRTLSACDRVGHLLTETDN